MSASILQLIRKNLTCYCKTAPWLFSFICAERIRLELEYWIAPVASKYIYECFMTRVKPVKLSFQEILRFPYRIWRQTHSGQDCLACPHLGITAPGVRVGG